MRMIPKRILIFAFTTAVVMAMVSDARPQDAASIQSISANATTPHGSVLTSIRFQLALSSSKHSRLFGLENVWTNNEAAFRTNTRGSVGVCCPFLAIDYL
jgi:hypothetical protein